MGPTGPGRRLQQGHATRAARGPRTASPRGGPPVASRITRAACLPSAASTANASCSTCPRTSARYRRSMSWRRNMASSARCASSVFATSMSPDVPASRRCTIPGRNGPPIEDERDPHAQQTVDQRAGPATLGRVRDQARRLGDHEQVVVLEPDRHAGPSGCSGTSTSIVTRATRHPRARTTCADRPVNGDEPRRDRPLDIGARHTREPREDHVQPTGFADERLSRHRAVGSGSWDVANDETASTTAPTTIAASATLKTGQTWKSTKSTTRPREARSAHDPIGQVADRAAEDQPQCDRGRARSYGGTP